jgi:hypothetical protein
MVDVETGAYRELKARYYADNTYGYTYYQTDAELRYLAQANTNSSSLNMWDLDADTVMTWKNLSHTNLAAVSKNMNRVIHGTLVMKATSLEVVDTLSEPVSAWYDDEKELAYYLLASVQQVQEVDVKSNAVLRTWKVRPKSGAMRRPSNSDWLYVFSTVTNGLPGGSQNLVEAIHLVTGERLTFEKYFWTLADGYPEFLIQIGDYFLPAATSCFARGSDAGHRNVLWEFDANSRRSDVVLDYAIMLFDRLGRQSFVSTMDKRLLLRCWDSPGKDSSILRCNALVPATTGTDEETGRSSMGDLRIKQSSSQLSIELVGTPDDERIQNVQVFATDGSITVTQPVSDPTIPVSIPIGKLGSGAYRCVVQTTARQLLSSFTIVR